MLALEFRFLAGRYHGNPWGRHVNEGDLDWPPEPWRFLRALIATWHHKIKHVGQHDEADLASLIDTLAEAAPEFYLPDASHSHTRHYLPQQMVGKTKLVWDAFAAVHPEKPLYMYWSALDLQEEQARLLDRLLNVMGYFGRAESWVEICRMKEVPGSLKPNCTPGDDPLDHATGELHGEVVSVHVPVAADEYARRRTEHSVDKKQAKRLAKTLPEGLLAALSLDTADLQKQGWSAPPAAQQVHYIRPLDALRPRRKAKSRSRLPLTTTARFLLLGKPLPRVEDSLRIAELMRRAVMSAFGKDDEGKRLAPPLFSGHDLPEGNLHQHAFYLPYDRSGNGRLDRIVLHVPAGFGKEAQRVIGELSRRKKGKLWQRNGGEWRLLLEGMGGQEVGGALTAAGRRWVSVTPYLHPWHTKKNFSVADQIRRECTLRGLPEITALKAVQTIMVGTRKRRPIDFHRFRSSRRNLKQPDCHGSYWEITFAVPVCGPLALGFSCHFGLGLFRPDRR